MTVHARASTFSVHVSTVCARGNNVNLLSGAVARIRNALAAATHTFFQQHGFLYVHTPIVTCSDAEGAGEMFQVGFASKGVGFAKTLGLVDIFRGNYPQLSLCHGHCTCCARVYRSKVRDWQRRQ